MTDQTSRRGALLGIVGASTALLGTGRARAAQAAILPAGAATLSGFTARLAAAPRRRDYSTVPMILDDERMWDAAALREVIGYGGTRKQVWDNTEIESPWLDLMRNSVNAQVYSFRNPDFLAVSATHGSAHLALFDQALWTKYRLAAVAGHGLERNSFIGKWDAEPSSLNDEDPKGVLAGPQGNMIPILQARGVVFLACHNAIWELTARLRAGGVNPDGLSHEAMAAQFTNHLIDGVVLTPGIVATLPELQAAGFAYAK
jgi:intracellular sulfur oxidation DsrE/DsrF family protein